ncbi:ABC transporter ATP-binding protein/permease [Timonella senegalensis]|uniref:ABC transporter ATP-binding protein/permease n=3 Tax=Timonella senegalensis TaxID=1465825 RepID=UPI002FDE06B6
MLQLSNIRKSYTTADFTQTALDDVSIAFRDNEFVAILGPSGSGKTTLLNIVGGLDHYDSGDLVIDGVPTSDYHDRDWDTYRNNRIGFVFQSYNLIPHQTVLANVELALTLSGVSRTERRERAVVALEQVGLGDHVHKLPSQMSGGQMQRVAIARALINDPEILLADEPTGALDSKTSVQIMALLTEIANDRLVIMVTHNPELAEEYATRTVTLRDGQISDDTDPFDLSLASVDAKDKEVRRTSMSFLTAISLSFKNLMTKKGRTLMTAFAGSIGIIGIAAILALANGVNEYIKGIEEDTLSLYPLTIQSQGMDFTAMMTAGAAAGSEANSASDDSDGAVRELQYMTRMFESIGSNDLAALKEFFDAGGDGIKENTQSIQYSYNVTPQIFANTASGARQVNPDASLAALGFGGSSDFSDLMPVPMGTSVFNQLVDDTSLIENQYDVVAGRWPQARDELVVVLTPSGAISDLMAFTMGLRDPAELDEMVKQFLNEEEITTSGEALSFEHDDLLAAQFTLVNASDYYQYDETYQVWTDKSADPTHIEKLVKKGTPLRVTGILKPAEGANTTALQPGVYYTSALVRSLMADAATRDIVKDQLAHPAVNVFSGRSFAEEEANPGREDFDLAKIMTVNEEAIKDAFTLDESMLTIDPSVLNLSMPALSIDPAALPQLDLGKLLETPDLNDLNLDLESILSNVDLSKVDLGLSGEDVSALAGKLATGYAAFCAADGTRCENPQTGFELFLESEEGSAILTEFEALQEEAAEGIAGAQQELIDQVTAQITEAVTAQVETQAASISSAVQTAMTGYMNQVMTTLGRQIAQQVGPALERQVTSGLQSAMGQLAGNMSNAMNIDEDKFIDAFSLSMSEEELTELLMSMMSREQSSLDSNLTKLGYASLDHPSSIDIYPKDFESKEQIISILDSYNERMERQGNENKVITYTDIVGALMSSVTTIINVVSYVLIAFVSISLLVSSIMIGVITYISVLERKGEIGILRAIGASKRDIRRVFNAETLIVGFVAGVIGIVVTVLLTIPTNAIVNSHFGVDNVAQLPWQAGVILIAISVSLTVVAGLIPSSAASRKDPVEALRSE